MNNILYDYYHKNRFLQKKIITDHNFTYRNVLKSLSTISKKSGCNILDIGCGVGTIDFYLASLGHQVYGIDISINAIKIAKENTNTFNLKDKLEFENISWEKFEGNQKFDIVIISEVLEHLIDDRMAVKKIKKYLTNNGYVLASSPSLNSPLYRLKMLEDFDKEVGHLRRYDSNSFSRLFEENDYRIVNITKVEGILRNFLFTNKVASKLIRYCKWVIADLVTLIDEVLLKVFGESNLILIAHKK